jgi:hypothetical protein
MEHDTIDHPGNPLGWDIQDRGGFDGAVEWITANTHLICPVCAAVRFWVPPGTSKRGFRYEGFWGCPRYRDVSHVSGRSADPNDARRCPATTTGGKRCRAYVVTGNDLCATHAKRAAREASK